MSIVNNVKIYGLEESVRASKYPMAVNTKELNSVITPTVIKLASSKKGGGHDNFLNGIVVQFDLTFTVKAWTEMERYHFMDFVSSQSTMHRITKFNLDNAYSEYVHPIMAEQMKVLISLYNDYIQHKGDWKWFQYKGMDIETIEEYNEFMKDTYLEILYSNPCGFKLTARMTTNYRQLKTIYSQRINHRLPEWREFCKWIETLPYAKEMIIGGK